MNFRGVACEHLAQYKKSVLTIHKDGIFHYRGKAIPKPHILPVAHREANILEMYRSQFWASTHANVKLHQFFHHLNSSQALCINLFYPLIVESKLDLFLQFLGITHEGDVQALFEKESDIEVATRRTSFDFYVRSSMAREVFVEVKYTEDKFGQAKNDEEHRIKFRQTYLPLVERSATLVPECRDERFFLRHYQILRNLVHIGDAGRVVLLFPSANSVVAKEAVYARDELLTADGRARLHVVFLEEFVSFLEKHCMNEPLNGYYQAFRAKYLPFA